MANWQVISLDTTTPQLRAPGTGDGYSFNSGSTQLGVWTTTGLGIGTTSPQAKLHVAAGNIVIDNNWGIAAFNNAATQESILSITTANNVNVSAPTLSGSLDFNIRNSTGSHRFFIGGTERVRITSAGDVGIGTTNPATKLHVAAGNVTIDNAYGYLAADNAGTRESILSLSSGNNTTLSSPTLSGSIQYNVRNASGIHQFIIGGTERARIDSSGRLLVGSTGISLTATSGSIEVANAPGILYGAIAYAASTSAATFAFAKSRGASVGTNTIVVDGDVLGNIQFRGANGSGFDQAAIIRGEVDGTPGASADMPGRLVFATSADGSATPTERMRISNAGNVVVNTAAVATTATDGFLYIPTCAGAPTGVPTTFTGRSPLVVDSTNNRFYVYVNGAWKYATLT